MKDRELNVNGSAHRSFLINGRCFILLECLIDLLNKRFSNLSFGQLQRSDYFSKYFFAAPLPIMSISPFSFI